MFNVTIINAKGSIKKIAILIVTLILLFIVTRFIQNLKSTEVFKINLSSKLVNCLNNEIKCSNIFFFIFIFFWSSILFFT